MRQFAVFFAVFALAVSPGSLHAADKAANKQPDRKGLDFFEKKIRPVLVKHCYECHSSNSKILRAKLLLDTRDGMRKGGESGPAVVPGKPDEGALLGALEHEDFEMPPKGKLPKNVIADFVAWVKMGAPDPRDGKSRGSRPAGLTIDLEKAKQFWSLRPVVKPQPPKVPGVKPPKSPIDRFIRAKLAEKGLQPAPPAKKLALIRRLYFDLIGLPPSPEDVELFLEDDSPQAVERLVDRLLASKQFGERWGRHWLDVARFAESSGGGRTAVYHLAWRYRDYVIRAFNTDKPFDRFVREQIAGDLLPWKTVETRRDQLTATGFLMLGPTNYELQDKELLRMEVVDEQLDTMGRAFLGMTIGCARCHDHKFDPIPNEDYYALAGIMRSTHILTPGNVSGYLKRPLPVNPEHARQLAAYERKVNPLKDELADLKERLKRLRRQKSGLPGKPGQGKSVLAKSLPGIVLDDDDAKFTGNWPRSSSIKPYVDGGYRYSTGMDAVARFAVKINSAGQYEVRLAYSAHGNRAALARVIVKHADGETVKRIDQRKTPPIGGLFLSLGKFRFAAGEEAVVELHAKNAHGTVIADAVQILTEKQAKEIAGKKSNKNSKQADSDLDKRIAAAADRIKTLQAELKQLQKSAPPDAPLAMAVADHKETGDYFICVRGNVHKLGEKVSRGFLRVITDSPPEISAEESGRRQLADWLADENNPLTARVFVNRVWHHLLGAGIVRTVDNFGRMGERPSHPKLLDWLAATFMEDGWSTKRLIRRIVLSETYLQSTRWNRRAAAADPENRLLWRHNRRRLDAEAIRDSILAVSGQLDRTFGGPTIPPKVNSEFGFKHTSLRRSVYVPAFRNTMHPLLAVFDLADPNLVSGKRNVSTLPTQALYLLNSPFVMAQSRHAADRLLKADESQPQAPGSQPQAHGSQPQAHGSQPQAHGSQPVGSSDSTHLDLAYRWCLGRPPTAKERKLSLAYLQEMSKPGDVKSRRQAWATLFQALFGSVDFRYAE